MHVCLQLSKIRFPNFVTRINVDCSCTVYLKLYLISFSGVHNGSYFGLNVRQGLPLQ